MSTLFTAEYGSATFSRRNNTQSSEPDADKNIVDYWVRNTIKKEILRGSNIRKEKPQNKPRERDYVIVTNGKKFKRNRKGRTVPGTNMPEKSYRLGIKMARKRNCPLRIAELARPSKRRCIETWKNNYKVLPAFIIERLQKYVKDETPMKIPDAIYYFKKGRSRLSKRYAQKKKLSEKHRRYIELKTMSINFAHKIAHELNKPGVAKLSPHLTKVSIIVADDIQHIMGGSTKYETTNRGIFFEMANKISLWMAMVLEESSLKLLEDALEDLEDEEGVVFDFIDDLMDNVLDNCGQILEHLESYETISDSLSQKEQFYEQDCIQDSEDKSDIIYSSDTDDITLESEYDHKKYEEVLRATYQDIVNLLHNIIDSMKERVIPINNVIPSNFVDQSLNNSDIIVDENKSSVNNVNSNDVVTNPKEINSVEKIASVPPNKDLFTEEIYTDEISVEVKSENKEAIPVHDEMPEGNIKKILQEADENDEFIQNTDSITMNDLSDSEVFETLYHDLSNEKNKKVMFSYKDLVAQKTSQSSNHSDTQLLENVIIYEEDDVLTSQTKLESIKSNISFLTPNEDLLSDADELWPKDIALIKPSESVSRSITSLGKILESDEKAFTSPDSISEINLEDSVEMISQSKNIQLQDMADLEEKNNKTYEILEQIPISRSYSVSSRIEIDKGSVGNISQSESKGLFVSEENNNQTDETLKHVVTSHSHPIVKKQSKSLQNSAAKPQFSSIKRPDIIKRINQKSKGIKENTYEEVSKKAKPYIKKKKLIGTINKNTLYKSNKSSTPNNINKIFLTETSISVKGVKKGKTLVSTKHKEKGGSNFNTVKSCKSKPDKIINKLTPSEQQEQNIEIQMVDKNIASYSIYSKPDYRVNTDTAPPWINRRDPREYSSKSYCTRTWIKDLNEEFEQIELWNEWITTVRKILAHKRGKIAKYDTKQNKKYYVSLKKTIDREAYLWRKLHKHSMKREHVLYICRKKSKDIQKPCCSKCCW